MVRFKNRHLLVEFLTPSTHSPTFPTLTDLRPPRTLPPPSPTDDQEENADDELSPIPPLPFLVPHHDGSSPRLKFGAEGGSVIFRAVRSVIQDVFGDEGWGRVASSFKGSVLLAFPADGEQ